MLSDTISVLYVLYTKYIHVYMLKSGWELFNK